MENKQNAKLSDVIASSLDGIKSMLDADTVIGTPIETNAGTTIIPLSKVSVGFVGGGNDYAGKNMNQAGIGGSGVTVNPVGFIVVNKDGDVNILNIDNPMGTNDLGSSIQTIIEKTPSIISKIKSLLRSNKSKDDDDAEDSDEE